MAPDHLCPHPRPLSEGEGRPLPCVVINRIAGKSPLHHTPVVELSHGHILSSLSSTPGHLSEGEGGAFASPLHSKHTGRYLSHHFPPLPYRLYHLVLYHVVGIAHVRFGLVQVGERLKPVHHRAVVAVAQHLAY